MYFSSMYSLDFVDIASRSALGGYLYNYDFLGENGDDFRVARVSKRQLGFLV